MPCNTRGIGLVCITASMKPKKRGIMKNKVLLAIADGLGDRPCEVLGWKTPLEYAKKPNLDRLAANGSSGIMDLYKAGVPVGTDLGHMLLFGYTIDDYPGRGPIEAFGEGIEMKPGDVALRSNFATFDEDMQVVDRRAGRIREGTKALAEALNGLKVGDVEIMFKEATEHRAVLVLRGEGLSSEITDTDPKKENLPVKLSQPKNTSAAAQKTADVLNRVLVEAKRILTQHPLNAERVASGLLPANGILTRGAGQMPSLDRIADKMGYKASCVAAETTVLGVARMSGFRAVTDPALTGNIDTDVFKKARLAVDELKRSDLVVLHFKATDLMGHDNNPLGKVEAVEKYDAMVGRVLELIAQEQESITEDGQPCNIILALAADHSTPCERREHSGDPVPIVISGRNIRKDGIDTYDETNASKGGLGRIQAAEFISTLLDYLEVTEKRGN